MEIPYVAPEMRWRAIAGVPPKNRRGRDGFAKMQVEPPAKELRNAGFFKNAGFPERGFSKKRQFAQKRGFARAGYAICRKFLDI